MPVDVKDQLRDVVNHLIKDDPDAAKEAFHDALSTKMRDRISPAPEQDDSTPPGDETLPGDEQDDTPPGDNEDMGAE